jgi:Ca-activated chloride channel family protein
MLKLMKKHLKTIASETGGKYFRATDNNKLKSVYKEINELEKAKIKTIEYDIDLPEKGNLFILFG